MPTTLTDAQLNKLISQGSKFRRSNLGIAIGTLLALPTVYTLGKEVHKSITMPRKIERSRDNMMSFYPQLKEYSKKDVDKYFNSLAEIAPMTATSPALAGAFVQKSLEAGGVDTRMMADVLDVEKRRGETTAPNVQKAFGESVAKTVAGSVIG